MLFTDLFDLSTRLLPNLSIRIYINKAMYTLLNRQYSVNPKASH